MDTYLGPQLPQQISRDREIQNGNTRDTKDLPPDRGVGHVHRIQGHLLPHNNSNPVQEIPVFSHCVSESYQFKTLPFGLSTASMEFTMVAKEGLKEELQYKRV